MISTPTTLIPNSHHADGFGQCSGAPPGKPDSSVSSIADKPFSMDGNKTEADLASNRVPGTTVRSMPQSAPADAARPTGHGADLVAGAGNKPNPFNRFEQIMDDYNRFIEKADQMKPDQRLNKLFLFQIQAQQAAFDVTLVSKVVEHATSGTRTLLQTQA